MNNRIREKIRSLPDDVVLSADQAIDKVSTYLNRVNGSLAENDLLHIINICCSCFRRDGIPPTSEYLKFYERTFRNPMDKSTNVPPDVEIPEKYPENTYHMDNNDILTKIEAELNYQEKTWTYGATLNQEKLMMKTYTHMAMMNWTHARFCDFGPSLWNLFIVCTMAVRCLCHHFSGN